MNIFHDKVKSKKPIFSTKRRTELYGTGPYDLRNYYQKELDQPAEDHKLVIFKNEKAPIQPIRQVTPKSENSEVENESSEDSGLENLSETSLPSEISEIEPIEKFDVKEYVRTVRNKYRILNYQDPEMREEKVNEDPTQFPIYARLNKLRKMRENNARKIEKTKAADVLKSNNDKFDKFMKKMIDENLEMSHPENYEGIYFKTHDEYVKFMKSKYTTKVDAIDLDVLYQKLGATYPRYVRSTDTNMIKSLRVTAAEYKAFEKYKLKRTENDYLNQEIDLYEFVVESRLKNFLKSIPSDRPSEFEKNERLRNITWKQLTSLKSSVAYFLQTQAHRLIKDTNYDIKDYQEHDPRTKYDPKNPKYHKEAPQPGYSLISRLKTVINILREVSPEKKKLKNIENMYESYFAYMRHRAPPSTKQDSRIKG